MKGFLTSVDSYRVFFPFDTLGLELFPCIPSPHPLDLTSALLATALRSVRLGRPMSEPIQC